LRREGLSEKYGIKVINKRRPGAPSAGIESDQFAGERSIKKVRKNLIFFRYSHNAGAARVTHAMRRVIGNPLFVVGLGGSTELTELTE
jgi:hypothetical protein